MTDQTFVPFAVEACLCPGTPHSEGDSLSFYPSLPFTGGYVAVRRIAGAPNQPDEVAAVLLETYLLHGIAAWTLVDEAGKPLPVTHPNIAARVLSNLPVALRAADHADRLYSERLLGPLATRAPGSSPP